jgi:hypothetical protein
MSISKSTFRTFFEAIGECLAELLPFLLVMGFFAVIGVTAWWSVSSGQKREAEKYKNMCTELGTVLASETRYMPTLKKCFIKVDGKFIVLETHPITGMPMAPGEKP